MNAGYLVLDKSIAQMKYFLYDFIHDYPKEHK